MNQLTPSNSCPICGDRRPYDRHTCQGSSLARIDREHRIALLDDGLEDTANDGDERSIGERLDAGYSLLADDAGRREVR